MSRTLLLPLIVLAALAVAGCGAFGERYEGEAEQAAQAENDTPITDEAFTAEVRKRDGCTEVKEFESEGNGHSSELSEKIEYESSPPHSGKHYQVAAEWGFYDEQQPDVQTVHNLEHGHIVISYDGLGGKELDELLDHARKNEYHLLVQPRKSNPKDGVYYTAWTAQVHCERPSAPALQEMIDRYRDQGPELFTTDLSNEEMGAE